jgi:hypothetical protein
MSVSRILAILAISILAVTGAARTGEAGHSKPVKAAAVPLPPVRPAIHPIKEAPIVMGRSSSVRHKSRLRHVKAKPPAIHETPAPKSSSEASLPVTPQP